VGGGSPRLQPEGRNLGIPAWSWRSHLQAGLSKWKSPSRSSVDDVRDVIGGTAAGILGGLVVRRRSRAVRRGGSGEARRGEFFPVEWGHLA